MTPDKELDIKTAGRHLAISIEEIIFCTVHPTLIGRDRREQAIKTFSENLLYLIKLITIK